MSPRPRLLLFVALVLAGAALLALGARPGAAWAAFTAHQAALRGWVAAAPLQVAAAYVALYVGSVLLSLPLAAVLSVSGGLLFGPVAGAALAVSGAFCGAVLAFLLARGALAPLLARRAAPFLDRLRPGLQRNGFAYLLALRLLPMMPFWLVNLAPALLGMKLRPYAAATLLGIIPTSTVLAGIGAGLGEMAAAGQSPDLGVLVSAPVLLPLLGLALLALLPLAWRRGRQAG